MSDYSIVQWYSEHEGYRCGYCKSPNTNYSQGMSAHALTVEDYQDLIDRGWRRSGTYVYKPTMNVTCCPMYTIRCDALKFQLSKSQKKVIKRVNNYLNFGIRPRKEEVEKEEEESADVSHPPTADIAMTIGKKDLPVEKIENECFAKQQPCSNISIQKPKAGIGQDMSKSPCKKAKLRRLEKKQKKEETKEISEKAKKGSGKADKTLEDYLNDFVEKPAHTLEVRLVRSCPASREFKEFEEKSYKLYKQYQMSIHGDKSHECTKGQFRNFLVDSPLKANEGRLPKGYGSFHQLYILDGQVIAVGVIDILPRCLSSVYLYYDPDYMFLSLGTYSALRELAFVRELNKMDSSIIYYYMGFYIHSCPKMRYKGQYVPSFLLCPESYSWNPIENCRTKLEVEKYSRFDKKDVEDNEGRVDINEVLVLHKREAMPYRIYRTRKSRVEDDDELVKKYAQLVGRSCSTRMLLYRP